MTRPPPVSKPLPTWEGLPLELKFHVWGFVGAQSLLFSSTNTNSDAFPTIYRTPRLSVANGIMISSFEKYGLTDQ
jgi:hypothetical protein